MKQITFENNRLGPFVSVEIEPDGYLVNGDTLYPFSVIGEGTVGDWVGTLPSNDDIALLKTQKNDEINEARLAANFTSFNHLGKAIACDQLSRSDIDGTNGYVALNNAMPPGWPGGWKALDNSYVPIADIAAWKAFYLSMFAAGNANFAKAQTLKNQLAQATTAAEISAIVW